MIAKKFRLQIQNWAPLKFFKKKNEFFAAKCAPNNLNFSRFGVVVGGKVSKSAVKRNRLKRAVFNLIRLKKFHLAPGLDCVVIALPQAGKINKSEIEKKIEDLLRKN